MRLEALNREQVMRDESVGGDSRVQIAILLLECRLALESALITARGVANHPDATAPEYSQLLAKLDQAGESLESLAQRLNATFVLCASEHMN
jgi:hypothetical protein